MLELAKKILEIKYESKVIKVNYPTVKQVSLLQNKMKSESDNIELILNFLEELGLSKSISETMQPDHLEAIINHLTDSKKN